MKRPDKRILLSYPHMSGDEIEYVKNAFSSNWIAPLGPHVDAFEKETAEFAGVKSALALSSGSAAIHLALILLGVGAGDTVFCSSLTFIASAAPAVYLNAVPVFIDSDEDTWNMSPRALRRAFKAAEPAEAAAAEAAEVAVAAAEAAGLGTVVAELVVLGALLGIGEHLIGLVDLLEALLGRLVPRVHVRVVLLGQRPVGLLDGRVVRVLGHAQNLVVVSFVCHICITLSGGKRIRDQGLGIRDQGLGIRD